MCRSASWSTRSTSMSATLAPRRVETLGPSSRPCCRRWRARRARRSRPGRAQSSGSSISGRCVGCWRCWRRERPVALVLDDLHWADEASVEFVLHLLRRPPRAACLLAFALRPGERGARLLAAARATPGWEYLSLSRCSEHAARALLAGLPEAGQRERVAARGGRQSLVPARAGARRGPGETALPATLAAAVRLDVGGAGAARRGRCFRAPRWPVTRSIPSWPRRPRGAAGRGGGRQPGRGRARPRDR